MVDVNKYYGLVNITLSTAIHEADDENVINPIAKYKQNYKKDAFFVVEHATIDGCADKLQELLDRIGELLTNEQTNTESITTT